MNSDKSEFASASLTAGQLNAIVKKLGGHEQALRFLRGDLLVSEPSREWREENGVIRFTVTSDGTSGAKWIKRLERKGCRVGDQPQRVLCSPDFKQTKGVVYEIAVLKGSFFGERLDTANIRAEADKRRLAKPHAEVACLTRLKFTDSEIEAMGLLWLVAMHEPINVYDGGPSLLGAERGDDSGRRLCAICVRPDTVWDCANGFMFVASTSLA